MNSTITATPIELEQLPGKFPGAAEVPVLNKPVLPFLNNVKVRVEVRVGGCESTVAQLLALHGGEILALDRNLAQPLDILVDGHVIARGTLCAVGEHFGIQITEAAVFETVR